MHVLQLYLTLSFCNLKCRRVRWSNFGRPSSIELCSGRCIIVGNDRRTHHRMRWVYFDVIIYLLSLYLMFFSFCILLILIGWCNSGRCKYKLFDAYTRSFGMALVGYGWWWTSFIRQWFICSSPPSRDRVSAINILPLSVIGRRDSGEVRRCTFSGGSVRVEFLVHNKIEMPSDPMWHTVITVIVPV